GIRRMYERGEDVFYYLTMMNEKYPQPAMPEGAREGIVKGMYRLRPAGDGQPRVHLLGSGAILNEAVKAQAILADGFGMSADVWSVTSYKELYRDAHEAERWNMRHPGEEPRTAYISQCLDEAPAVAATDYVQAVPDTVTRWVPGRFVTLGTDGYGRSDGRDSLRDFFEVDARHIALAALHALAREGQFATEDLGRAAEQMYIDPDKPPPSKL
ncbi:MAG: pyruvate dehydrogenase (acetyl-transferring), homodimeric type, partial [Candidatus Brocadiia bacterium]